MTASLERGKEAARRAGAKTECRRAEERRTRGRQLGQRTAVSTGEDPRSCWTHGAPSLTRSLRSRRPPPPPSRPPLLRPAPAQSPQRRRGRRLHRRSRSRRLLGQAWRGEQRARPGPSFLVTPQPTPEPVPSPHRSCWGPSRTGGLRPALPPAPLPCGPSAAGTRAGPTGPAGGAGSGAAAMPAGSLPATCSPCAWARAPTAAP